MIPAIRRLSTVACACLGLLVAAARAESPSPTAVGVPAAVGMPRPAELLAQAIAAEAARPLPPYPLPAPTPGTAGHRAFGLQPFADHYDPAQQLRSLRHLRVLRLWDNTRVSVFFGVNRAGLPGLHFQQRDPDDLPPSPAGTISSDLPLLRALLPRAP